MSQKIDIELPFDVSEEEYPYLVQRAKEAILMYLFEKNKISEKQVRALLSLTRREFHRLMRQYGVPSLRTEKEAHEEIEASDALHQLWNFPASQK